MSKHVFLPNIGHVGQSKTLSLLLPEADPIMHTNSLPGPKLFVQISGPSRTLVNKNILTHCFVMLHTVHRYGGVVFIVGVRSCGMLQNVGVLGLIRVG